MVTMEVTFGGFVGVEEGFGGLAVVQVLFLSGQQVFLWVTEEYFFFGGRDLVEGGGGGVVGEDVGGD